MTSGELSLFWQGADAGYVRAHKRHQKTLADQPCAHADGTCSESLQSAFRHDTPEEFVKVDPLTGCRYSTRTEDYRRLCASHHSRYDNGHSAERAS